MTEKWIIRNGEIVNTETHMTFDSFMEIIIVLNGQSKELANLHEENQALKDALWIAETEYIHERYFDNPIRKEESINELKEDFKRGYWND